MFDAATRKLFSDKLKSPPLLVMETSLARDIDELTAAALPVRSLAVVDDKFTAHAYGDRVFLALKSRFSCIHLTLDGRPAPDDATAEYVRQKTARCDALAAVGGGTVNDLCKYAAHAAGKPYIVFPTAASMNGYLSANASIAVAGYKKTMTAAMPLAVFCDLSVIADAPDRLSKSGLGDALARPTAQADWLLSHLLLGTKYDETPFALLKPFEPELWEHARGIAMGDRQSIALLMKILLLSGLGMTIAGGSYPASQAEHMIAHAYNMLSPPPYGGRVAEGRVGVSLHGEEIAVTALAMAAMQEQLLRGKPAMRRDGFDEPALAALFSEKVVTEARKAFEVKQNIICHSRESGNPSNKKMDPRVKPEDDITNWSSLAEKISAIHMPPARMRAIIKAAQLPESPEAIGWDGKTYGRIVECARYLRERFTFLDIQ